MKPQDKALKIFNTHYVSIMECGGDFGQEILISMLAIKASVITVKQEYKSAREVLFNLKSCTIIESEKVYLFRIQELINQENEIIYFLNKL